MSRYHGPEYMRAWRAKNRERNDTYQRQRRFARRLRVIEHYGGHCQCCGESDYRFLALDHVEGGGEIHRQKVGQGSKMVDWIIRSEFPSGFRVLCHNCNQAIGYYGECPHVETLRLVVARDE